MSTRGIHFHGQLKRLLINAGKGAIEEGGQETLQNIAENVIASDLVAYDPERGTFQGTGEAAGVGGSVGALFNVLASMLGVKVALESPRLPLPSPLIRKPRRTWFRTPGLKIRL